MGVQYGQGGLFRLSIEFQAKLCKKFDITKSFFYGKYVTFVYKIVT